MLIIVVPFPFSNYCRGLSVVVMVFLVGFEGDFDFLLLLLLLEVDWVIDSGDGI